MPSNPLPIEIRKCCLILGIQPEQLTIELVHQAWKKQLTSPEMHPDFGGDVESAKYLNAAKDTLTRWLEGNREVEETQAPVAITAGPHEHKDLGWGRGHFPKWSYVSKT